MASGANSRDNRGLRWAWHLGGLSLVELARRVAREADKDDVLGRSAQLSYYLVLALFPFLILLSSVAGFAFKGNSSLYTAILDLARPVVPDAAYQLILATVQQITQGAGGGLLSVGALGTLWAASSGMQAIIDGLNVAYQVREFRSWWKRRLIAIVLTILLLVFTLIAFVAALWGSRLLRHLAEAGGVSGAFEHLYALAEVVLPVVFMLLVFVIIHQFAPNVRGYSWMAQLPGAVAGVACWLLTTWGFRLYVSSFGNYNKTYGGLGAMIILLLWLYLTGIAVLIGGEINSEIRKAAAARGAQEARQPIEAKPEG